MQQVLGQIFSLDVANAFDRECERWLEQNKGHNQVAILDVLPKNEGVTANSEFCEIAQEKLENWLFK